MNKDLFRGRTSKNLKFGLIIMALFLVLLASCDLLRKSPYEVEAWTPGEGFHSDPAGIRVSLLLSHESDRARTEQAFSLTEDRRTLKGDFSWDGARLFFIPAAPLEADRDYLITLGTGAQDTRGLSLEQKFEASFSTRPACGKPRITGTEPEDGGTIPESRGEFRLFFSEPISLDSCRDYVSFSPSTPGSWRLEDENRSACFIPREPWQTGNLYRVKVEKDFAGSSGVVLGEEYSSVFFAGVDREKPVLIKVLALLADGVEEEIPVEEIFPSAPGLSSPDSYSGWENGSRLCLVFSEPVDLGGVKNILLVEPLAALVMESPPEILDRAVFRFVEYPEWGSSFLFRLCPGVTDRAGNKSAGEYAFRITCSGPLSKAPALAGIRLPMAPGNGDDQMALHFTPEDLFGDLPITCEEGHYPYTVQTPSWVELYFDASAEIDLFSVMDLFRVEATNQALGFSPRSISADDFSIIPPEPGWENFRRVEIRGMLTNTVHSGIVTFRIPAGLKDKRGNRSSLDFRISLLK